MEDPIEKRLESKNGKVPKWAEDFPVESKKEANIARRDFIRYLSFVSLGLFMGQAAIFGRKFFGKKEEDSKFSQPFRIAGLEDIEVGGSYVFSALEQHEPILLIRLSQNDYVAYSQKCTHLQCPVIWRKEESKILCPCHHGAFDARSGAVLYGPPERSLPKAQLSLRQDGIYFEGLKKEG